MTQSWFQNDEIAIHDGGTPEIPALFMKDENGEILLDQQGRPRHVLDEKGEPKQQYQPARGAWPEDAKVYVKSRVTVGDYETIQALSLAKKPSFSGGESGATVEGELGIMYQPLSYAAVLVTRFEGEVFTDPATGQIVTLPKDVQGRLEKMRQLPLEVLGFLFTEINDKAGNPLAGTTPVETKRSGDDTGRKPTPIRRSSQKSS